MTFIDLDASDITRGGGGGGEPTSRLRANNDKYLMLQKKINLAPGEKKDLSGVLKVRLFIL